MFCRIYPPYKSLRYNDKRLDGPLCCIFHSAPERGCIDAERSDVRERWNGDVTGCPGFWARQMTRGCIFVDGLTNLEAAAPISFWLTHPSSVYI